MKELFICVGDENKDNPCYVNIYNIDYIIRKDSCGENLTFIRFRGSENTISTSMKTKEIIRRIKVALNGSTPKDIVERFDLLDIEE